MNLCPQTWWTLLLMAPRLLLSRPSRSLNTLSRGTSDGRGWGRGVLKGGLESGIEVFQMVVRSVLEVAKGICYYWKSWKRIYVRKSVEKVARGQSQQLGVECFKGWKGWIGSISNIPNEGDKCWEKLLKEYVRIYKRSAPEVGKDLNQK